MAALNDFRTRHRGPYIFCVLRPHPKKPAFSKTEWLKGEVDGLDVEDEARALLADPRDTILAVSVWSQRENMFVTTFTREA